MVIFGSEEGLGDDPDFNIICHARIIRVDEGNPGKRPPGFGVTIDPVDDDNRERLTKLLLRAEHFRVGEHPTRTLFNRRSAALMRRSHHF